MRANLRLFGALLLLLTPVHTGAQEVKIEKFLDLDGVKELAVKLVAQRTQMSVTSIRCPQRVLMEQGNTFTCTANGDDGTELEVTVEQTSDTGSVYLTVNDPMASKLLLPIVRRFMAGWEDGELAAAYAKASPMFRSAMSLADLEAYAACRLASLGEFVTTNPATTSFVGRESGTAMLNLPLAFDRGTVSGDFAFANESGQWRLTGFQVAFPPADELPAVDLLAPAAGRFLKLYSAGDWSALHATFPPDLGRNISAQALEAQLAPALSAVGPVTRAEPTEVTRNESGLPVLQIKGTFEGGKLEASFTFAPCGDQWQLFAYEFTPLPDSPPAVKAALLEGRLTHDLEKQLGERLEVVCPNLEQLVFEPGTVVLCQILDAAGETSILEVTVKNTRGSMSFRFGKPIVDRIDPAVFEDSQ